MKAQFSRLAPAILLVLSFACSSGTAANAAQTSPKLASVKTFDPNAVHVGELFSATSCLPNEPVAKSDVAANAAIAAGDANLDAGHCQQGIADYQKALDANPNDPNALFRHLFALYAVIGSTGDAGMHWRYLESAYHDADAGVAAAPKNVVFLVLRASPRLALVHTHMEHRAPASWGCYQRSEYQHSYDDVTAAMTLYPTYGEGYASRWQIDKARQDEEQAAYDYKLAAKYDPSALAHAENMHRRNVEQAAENMRALENSRRHLANAMMGLGAAAGGYILVPGP